MIEIVEAPETASIFSALVKNIFVNCPFTSICVDKCERNAYHFDIQISDSVVIYYQYMTMLSFFK